MLRIRFGRAATAAFVTAAVAAGLCAPSWGSDWPQWRGAARNGTTAETGWTHQWGPRGPRRAWSVQVGEGFSSVAVVGNRVYTLGNSGGRDTVWCLDAATGRPVWRQSYPCQAGDYGGPRATPTVDGPNVYTLSREARAGCFNAANGRPVWQVDLARQTGAQTPTWGFAGSPLVYGNLVIYNVGSAGCAVDKATGRIVWKSGGGAAGYSSPAPFVIGRQRGVALFVAKGVVGVDAANGRILWQHPWNTSYDVNAADPIVLGDSVFISSNYNRGCALIRVAGGRAGPVWENRSMRNHFNTCVFADGALFGNDENTLKCIDARTGNERWRSRGMGKGGLILAGKRLIALTERGELIVAAAASNGYSELARAKVLQGTCWTHPVLANGMIYCRSHEGELVCLDVRGR